jgi:hypothetical protein
MPLLSIRVRMMLAALCTDQRCRHPGATLGHRLLMSFNKSDNRGNVICNLLSVVQYRMLRSVVWSFNCHKRM